MEIPTARRLCPSARIFSAALMSRSFKLRHLSLQQRHSLIRKSALPFGLLVVISPQLEQTWVVKFSLTSSNNTPAFSHLYLSIVLNAAKPVSNTDLAILVFTSFAALKSPITISALFLPVPNLLYVNGLYGNWLSCRVMHVHAFYFSLFEQYLTFAHIGDSILGLI